MNKVLVITGPTASGKTALAIQKAQELNGEIINYDRLQVYKDLPILTAYPTLEEISSAPHRLFGYLSYNDNISVVDWAELAANDIREVWNNGKLPILVGGTGMYIEVLIHGISPLPARSRVSSLGSSSDLRVSGAPCARGTRSPRR